MYLHNTIVRVRSVQIFLFLKAVLLELFLLVYRNVILLVVYSILETYYGGDESTRIALVRKQCACCVAVLYLYS